jgi:hypothetical protein
VTRPVPRDAGAARPPARHPYTELVDTRNWRAISADRHVLGAGLPLSSIEADRPYLGKE